MNVDRFYSIPWSGLWIHNNQLNIYLKSPTKPSCFSTNRKVIEIVKTFICVSTEIWLSITHRGRTTHVCVTELGHNLFRYWFASCLAASHYLNQCWPGWRMHICIAPLLCRCHADVIKWKRFPRYWPFVRGIHRSSVNFRHKGQWRGALMFSLICAWTNGWANNRDPGDLRCHHVHYNATVMRSWHHGNIMTAPSAVRWFIQRSKELIFDPIIGF